MNVVSDYIIRIPNLGVPIYTRAIGTHYISTTCVNKKLRGRRTRIIYCLHHIMQNTPK